MQTRSRTREMEIEDESFDLPDSRRRNSDSSRLMELRGNNDRLTRRVAELEAQLRNQQSSHGSGASRTISNLDSAGSALDSSVILGYDYNRLKRIQTGNCSKFDGIRESGSQWVRHLERSGKRFNWDHISQLATLIDSLEGKVKTWFDTLPLDRQEDLSFLKQEIRTKFTKGESAASAMVKLSNLKMKPDQDVEEYWYEIKKECHLANDRMDLASVVSWFVNGLPVEIKESIIEQTSEMNEKVVELARRKQLALRIRKKDVPNRVRTPVELIVEKEHSRKEEKEEELVQQISKAPFKDERRDRKEDLEREFRELKRTVYELSKKIGTTSVPRIERNPVERELSCFHCHQKGHLRKECPVRNRSYPSRPYGKKRSYDQNTKERVFKKNY